MRILWEERAWEEYCYWQTQDKKTLKKINKLINNIQRDLYGGLGKPEPLKCNYSGYWSRRIDNSNRIVYKINDSTIIIVTCKGHYDD